MKGTVYVNNGYWWYAVRLPGEKKRKARKLCAPGSDIALHADRSRDVAILAARKIWEAATRRIPTTHIQSRTVDEVCGLFIEHCHIYYRHPDGTQTGEAALCQSTVRLLRDLFADRPVAELQHSDMLALRDAFIRRGLCRRTVNAYMERCKRMWFWALDEGYISATQKAELTQAQYLKAFRSEAPERAPIKPASANDVEATIALLIRNVSDMVRVHQLTGMRPNEVCLLAWENIDTSSTPWVYRPALHKTQWRGQVRAILIGPRARAILEQYRKFPRPFSPLAAIETEQDNPSGLRRGVPEKVTDKWTAPRYASMIRIAARAAGVPSWTPNRLRHAFATEVRRKYGILVAAALLGHEQAFKMTAGYSSEAAIDELLKIGTETIEEIG